MFFKDLFAKALKSVDVKELVKSSSAASSSVAVVSAAPTTQAAAPEATKAAKEEKKEESEDEDDGDMGFGGLFLIPSLRRSCVWFKLNELIVSFVCLLQVCLTEHRRLLLLLYLFLWTKLFFEALTEFSRNIFTVVKNKLSKNLLVVSLLNSVVGRVFESFGCYGVTVWGLITYLWLKSLKRNLMLGKSWWLT